MSSFEKQLVLPEEKSQHAATTQNNPLQLIEKKDSGLAKSVSSFEDTLVHNDAAVRTRLTGLCCDKLGQ